MIPREVVDEVNPLWEDGLREDGTIWMNGEEAADTIIAIVKTKAWTKVSLFLTPPDNGVA